MPAFLERVHVYGSSKKALVGLILYTAGTVLPLLLYISIENILTLVLVLLPIIGLWLIFAKRPLIGLTLMKINAIIKIAGLLSVIAISIILIIIFAILGQRPPAGIEDNGQIFAVLVIIFLATALAASVFAICFYYFSLLRVLKSVRNGIRHNNVTKIKGIVPFAIAGFLGIFFSGIGNLTARTFSPDSGRITTLIMRELILGLSAEYRNLITFEPINILGNNFAVNVILLLSANIGLILIMIALIQFSVNIKKPPAV
jgi:hypothetical protein